MSHHEFLDSRPEEEFVPSFEPKRHEPNVETSGTYREPRHIGNIIGLPQFVEPVKRPRVGHFFRDAKEFHIKSGHYFYHPLLWLVVATDHDSNGSLCIPIMIAEPDNIADRNNRSHFRGFLDGQSLMRLPDWAQNLAIRPVHVEMHPMIQRIIPEYPLIVNYSSVELIDHSRSDIIVGEISSDDCDFVVSTVARLFPPHRLVKIKRLTEKALKVERILSTSRSMNPSDKIDTSRDYDNDSAADYGSVVSLHPRDMKDGTGTTSPSLRFVNELLEATIRASPVENATTIEFNTFWTQFTATTSLVVGIGSLTVGVGSYHYAKQMASQRKPKSKDDGGGDNPPIELPSRRPPDSSSRPGPGPGQSGELPASHSNISGIRSTQTNLPQQSLPVVCPDEEQETPSPMRSRLHQETNDNSIDHSGSSAPGAIDLKPESKSFWKEAFAIDEQQNKLRRKTEIGPQEMVDKMEKIIDEKNSDIDKLRTTSNRLIGEISRIQSDLNSKCLELDTTRKETAQVESKLLEQLEDTKTRLKVANAHYEQEKRDHHRIQEEMEAANKETSAKLKRTSDMLTKWQESHRQIKHQYETTTAELKCIHDDSRNNYIDIRKELQITSRNLELTRAEMNTKDREFQQMKAEMNTKDREFQQIKAKMNTNDQEFQQMTAEFNRLRLRRVELYCTQQQLKDARVQIKALEEDLARKTTETPGSLGAPEEDDEIGDHDLGRNTDLQCPMEPVQEAPQKDGEDDLDQESDAARDSVLTESFPVEAPMHSEATQSHLVEGSDD